MHEPTKYKHVYKVTRKNGTVRFGTVVRVGSGRNRYQKRKETFSTAKAADEWRIRQLGGAGDEQARDKRTFGAWIEDYCTLRRPEWEYGSEKQHRWALNQFSALHGVRLRDVSAADLEVRLSELRSRYKPNTVRVIRRILSACFNAAVGLDLIPRNPVLGTKSVKEGRERPVYWDAERVNALLTATQDDEKFGLAFHVLAVCWLRVGELCGLTWDDVDLAKGTLRVARTARVASDGGFTLGTTTKSLASARVIALTPPLVRGFRERLDRDRMAEKELWHPGRAIFANGIGEPIHQDVIRDALKRACLSAGLPVITPHDLRHAGATIAIRGGLDPKVVSQRLGHSTVRLTLDRYVWPDAADQERASQRIADLLSVG